MQGVNEMTAVDANIGMVCGGGARYVARLPILDVTGKVHGYDLLFRNGLAAFLCSDSDRATRVILDEVVVYGVERLTGGLPAFVPCTEETVTDYMVEAMRPSITVLDLQLSREPSLQLLSILRLLKAGGFRLALGSSCWQAGYEPLLRLADYFKVDFSLQNGLSREVLRDKVGNSGAALIANHVNTQEAFLLARKEGFKLFQGSYFCQPELLKNRVIPANHLARLRILQYVQSADSDLHKLAQMVMEDPSLSYRLLRLVNSPLFATRQEVHSIEAALFAVGQEAFKRIATLAAVSQLNAHASSVVLLMSLARAKFCEQIATRCGLDPAEQYMMGLLSLLPVMLRVAMTDLTPSLPLRPAVRDALNGHANPERKLLSWLESYERGDWEDSDAIAGGNGLFGQHLADAHVEAVYWSQQIALSVL